MHKKISLCTYEKEKKNKDMISELAYINTQMEEMDFTWFAKVSAPDNIQAEVPFCVLTKMMSGSDICLSTDLQNGNTGRD